MRDHSGFSALNHSGPYGRQAGLRGCVANVRINTPAINDQAVVDELTRSVDALDEGVAT